MSFIRLEDAGGKEQLDRKRTRTGTIRYLQRFLIKKGWASGKLALDGPNGEYDSMTARAVAMFIKDFMNGLEVEGTIEELQSCLIDSGYADDELVADGEYGAATKRAVSRLIESLAE